MKKYVYFIPSICWMILIFYMSHQVGTDSSSMSNEIVSRILQYIPIEKETLSFIVRKCAHMFEYFMLYLFLFYAFYKTYKNKKYAIPFIFSVLYACSDEFHQLFVVGRTGLFSDVCIDTIGISIALLFVAIYFRVLKKSH